MKLSDFSTIYLYLTPVLIFKYYIFRNNNKKKKDHVAAAID